MNLLGFDDSPEGERMRRHQMKCFGELWRGVQAYRKVRRGGGWRVTGGGGQVVGGGWRVTGGGQVGGVADEPERTSEEDNSAVAGGGATERDKRRDLNLEVQKEQTVGAGKGGMSGFTSGGGGGDPFRGMSKRVKRKARREEKEKREAERRLELAKADMDAELGPSVQMMRELVQTSPELAEYMRTNIFQ